MIKKILNIGKKTSLLVHLTRVTEAINFSGFLVILLINRSPFQLC